MDPVSPMDPVSLMDIGLDPTPMKQPLRSLRSGCAALVALVVFSQAARPDETPDALSQALVRAGDQRPELEMALAALRGERRKGLVFLLSNMPVRDLTSLSAGFLLENVNIAYDVRASVPWGKTIPEAIFLNDVLPYASINERRDAWRKPFSEKFLPIVAACQTAAEAAQKLNEKVFGIVNVRYSRQRKKPDQSPFESMEIGMASCTGLSVLLTDACRAVGVPARVVGIPSWVNKRGNHTWVEVWDETWHFAGACEPDRRGLNHGWFEHDASLAQRDSLRHAIYATSFLKTDLTFPMVWARGVAYVSAVNVTDRYAKTPPLTGEQRSALEKAARTFFDGRPTSEPQEYPQELDALLLRNPGEVRGLVWEIYRRSLRHDEAREDFENSRVRSGEHESPYKVREVGEKPEGGWPLFIALHGGGGVPKRVNDSQWRVMQRYYRDQESVPGYLYLALRAPNDRWNGFYDDYVYPLVTRLIQQFLLFGDVDANRVFVMGYSHGGYGVFSIGPKIPHRFAAVHSSAAAPTDGESSPKNLRNTRFTFMIGERDTAYGRLKRCQAFDEAIQDLRGDRKDIFPVTMEYRPGHGHSGLPDRDKIKDMYSSIRNPVPRELVWELTDGEVKEFFWLSVTKPGKNKEVRVDCEDNVLEFQTTGDLGRLTIYLDDRLIDFHRPVIVRRIGASADQSASHLLRPSLGTLCESLLERGDIHVAFATKVIIDVPLRSQRRF